jgi:hypothetical protein
MTKIKMKILYFILRIHCYMSFLLENREIWTHHSSFVHWNHEMVPNNIYQPIKKNLHFLFVDWLKYTEAKIKSDKILIGMAIRLLNF